MTSLQKSYPPLAGRFAFNFGRRRHPHGDFPGVPVSLSLLKDIRRVFEYHGAEHKVVFNFESGQPVTVANAQSFTTFHPRCGTSFLLVVMLVSMAGLHGHSRSMVLRPSLSPRIVLLPVIAGLSYELIRFAAKRRGSVLATLTAPGLWLQRITTQSAHRRADGRGHPCPGRRHGARKGPGRTNWSSPDSHPCNSPRSWTSSRSASTS